MIMQYKAIDWLPKSLTWDVPSSNFNPCNTFLNKVLLYSPNHTSLHCSTQIRHIQSSTRLEDGDNPLEGSNEIAPQHRIIHSPWRWRQPLGGSSEIVLQHTIIHSTLRWRQPTWRQQRDWSTTYNYPFAPQMETTHSEAAIRLLHNIQPFTCP